MDEDFLGEEEATENPSMFTQKPGSFRRGMGETAVTSNVSQQSGFAARIAPPVWRMFVDNAEFQKKNAQAIAGERSAVSQSNAMMERQMRDATRQQEKLDPNKLGFERELDDTSNEISRISLSRQDPNFKRLSKDERELFEGELSMKETSAARRKELEGILGKEKQLDEEDQRLYQLKVKRNELRIGGIPYWQQTYAQQQKDIADQANEAAANSQSRRQQLETADASAAQEETALMQKMKQGVRGTELAETQAKLKEIKQVREGFAEQKSAPDQEVEGVRTQAQQALDGERRQREAAIREKMVTRRATDISGVERSFGEKALGVITDVGREIGEIFKNPENAQSDEDVQDFVNSMIAKQGGREKFREFLTTGNIKNKKAAYGGLVDRSLALLNKQDAELEAAGITDPAERERVFTDAVKEREWTTKDTDNVRALSTGEVVINPARAFGQRDEIAADIQAKAGSEADAAEGIARLDAMRANLAEKMADNLWYADKDYQKHAIAMEKAGISDTVQILDSYAAMQRDRNGFVKFGDALITAAAETGASIYKSAVGGAAGISAAVGADELAGDLGYQAKIAGDAISASNEASETRGLTGGYKLAKDFTVTVGQMAPMFIGGAQARAMEGIGKAIVGGMSVYGTTALQMYESKLSEAVEMERGKLGGDITKEKIAETLGRPEVQLSALANAAQGVILAKWLGGGAERAAIGEAAKSMTVRDFLTKGGRKALMDSTVKAELKKMAKTIFADAGDEFVEEGISQFLDKAISSVGLGEEFKLGDALVEAFQAGAMGAAVGGVVPQFRRGGQAQTAIDEAAAVSTRLVAQDPSSPKATQEEINKARQYASTPQNLDEVARNVAAIRQIETVAATTQQALTEAQEQFTQAQATGDPVAIAQAEQTLRKATTDAAAPDQTKGLLKINSGKPLETLTDAEVKALGITRTGKPASTKELADAGLSAPLVSFDTADGSPIITDAGIAVMGNVSPEARASVKMDETQARAAAIAKATAAAAAGQQGAAAPAAASSDLPSAGTDTGSSPQAAVPATSPAGTGAAPAAGPVFRVTGTNGTVMDVPARSESEAQNIAVSDPAWQAGERVDSVLDVTEETAAPEATEATAAAPEEIDPINNPPAGTAAPAAAPQETSKALTRIKKTLAKAKKMLGDKVKIVSGADKPGAVAYEDGTIEINLEELKAKAAAQNMTEDEASIWISKSIDEEVRHAAQHRAAFTIWKSKGSPGDYTTWRNTHYKAIWQNEFVATGKDKMVMDLYGKKLKGAEAWQKAFEGLRMIQQKAATGSPTEVAKLWANLTADAVAHIKAALKALKEFVASGLSPELQVEIDAITAQLAEYDKAAKAERKAKAATKTPSAPTETPTGSLPDGQASTSRDVEEAAAPVQPSRVTFVRNGETLTGKFLLQSEKNGQILLEVNGRNILVDPSEVVQEVATPKGQEAPAKPAKAKQDKEWESFGPESLGIPRAEMPQIKAEDRAAMVQFLRARGIDYTPDVMMRPSQISPTQAEYSPEKVAKAKAYEGGDRAILISANGRIVDGHHQWLAAMETNPDEPIKVIVLDAPILQILETVKEMPSVTTAEGGTEQKAPSMAAEKPSKEERKPQERRIPDLSQKEYAKRKRALNKAINAKDWPTVLAKANEDLLYFAENGYPDDWSNWQRAKEDAENAITPRNYFGSQMPKPYVEPAAAPAPEPAAKPTLTKGEQSLKDAFSGLVDGLETADLNDEYFKQGIPPAKIGQFIGAAQSLIAEGVTTPAGLAAALDKISPKLRVYSESVWSAFRMVDPSLPQAVKWQTVYGEMDAGKVDNQQQTVESNANEKDQSNTGDESQIPGEPVEQGTSGPLEAEPGSQDAGTGTPEQLPESGGNTGESGNTGSVRGNASRPSSRSGASKPKSGDGTERSGTGSQEGPDSVESADGSGVAGGKQPPIGYRITDPEAIIGSGGPKARFNRNRLALETYDKVLSENRAPTKEEQDIIAAYIGWGSFGQELFQGTWERPNPQPSFEKESEWLREHLGKEGWESIRDSIINAHYTDPPHIQALWRIVEHLGFKGGRVLEPSMGIGSFFGLMPDIIRAKSSLTGIELDRVVGGMAKMLYPDANIRIMGYEKSATADGFYDLVIGNWPFAADGPSDARYNALGLTLHDYFFVKALDQTRPGGLVIGITSSGSMDKKGQTARRQMAKRAELVGAFRFPTGAFEKYAGTKVVTDVIILKKRDQPLGSVEEESWIKSVEFGQGSQKFSANEYWQKNPSHVLGEMKYGHGTTQGRAGMIVVRDDNYQEQLEKIHEKLPKDIYGERTIPEPVTFQNRQESADQNSIVWDEGNESTPTGFYIVRGEQLQPLDDVFAWKLKDAKKNEKRTEELKGLLGMREAITDLLRAQREGDPNTETIRKETKAKYDAFVKAHGSISESFMLRGLDKAQDSMALTLKNLERKEGKKFIPRDILLKDIMRRPVANAKGSIEDAYAIHRNQSTTLNISEIARISGKPEQEVIDRLLELDQIYKTPVGEWEAAEEYLGGNVRRKLREAIAAKDEGIEMDRNIEALKKVQPKDVAYFEIEVQMGASWIPKSDYLQFAAHLLGGDPESAEKDFTLNRAISGWNFKVENPNLKRGTGATSTWGTQSISFSKIFQAAMNGTNVKVYNPKDSEGRVTLNEEETDLANKKVDDIREELSQWLWSDPARVSRIATDYNELMNSEVVPKRNGSHLRFEGLALTMGKSEFDFRQHQKDAVWRGIMDGRMVAAHEVGTGKTFTMAGLAVEGRRLGKFRKSLVFAHNANAESVYLDFKAAYPAGKFLFVNNLSPENRDNAMRQIASDEWDAVVVPHSLIDRFSLREETLMEIAQKEITQLESEIADELESIGAPGFMNLDDEKEVASALKFVKDSHTAKDLVKTRARIIKRIKDKAAKAAKEKAVYFEDLGVDAVIVDEAHIFKKIALATRKSVKGLNKTESERGWMLGAITDTVKARNNGKGVFLFTGTPLTNNLNEAYNMMKYVMDDAMAEAGINGFDDWFNAFAQSVSDVELTTGGTYEPVTRLLSFVNVPELARLAGRFFDVVQAKSMPEFIPRESMEGKTPGGLGRPFKVMRPITAEMSQVQKDHKESIQRRYKDFQALSGRAKRNAMMLGVNTPIQLETEGIKAALDMRLVDPAAPDFEGSKVNMMIRNAISHYEEDPASTQMIFMERGWNDFTDAEVSVKDADGMPVMTDEGKRVKQKFRRKQFNLVRDMVEKLVAQGVKPEEIAVFSNMSLDTIADRPNDVLRKVNRVTGKVSKEDLAALMREGKIRFAFGSTQTMGTGVNAQDQMRAMHHLDAPWTPGEFEQRNGRGHRQGNEWNTVFEYRYFTEGSHDGRRWQVLLNKVKFISLFTEMLLNAGGAGTRVLTGDGADLNEGGSDVSDFEQSFSTAAGDPRILVRAKLSGDVTKLERRRDTHYQSIGRAKSDIKYLKESKVSMARNLEMFQQAIDSINSIKDEPFEFKISYGGKENVYTERKDAENALAAFPSLTSNHDGKIVGYYKGFPIRHKFYAGTLTPSVFSVEVPLKTGVKSIQLGTLSLSSIEANLRGQTRAMENVRDQYDKIDGSVAELEEMIKKPFTRQAELDAKQAALDQINVELARSPEPAPSWLRNGSPAGSLVYLEDGNAYDVAAHRWDQNGWWVLVETESGMIPVDYRKVFDESGTAIFEEREFVAPKKEEANDITPAIAEERIGRDYALVPPEYGTVNFDNAIFSVQSSRRWRIFDREANVVAEGNTAGEAYLAHMAKITESERKGDTKPTNPSQYNLAGFTEAARQGAKGAPQRIKLARQLEGLEKALARFDEQFKEGSKETPRQSMIRDQIRDAENEIDALDREKDVSEEDYGKRYDEITKRITALEDQLNENTGRNRLVSKIKEVRDKLTSLEAAAMKQTQEGGIPSGFTRRADGGLEAADLYDLPESQNPVRLKNHLGKTYYTVLISDPETQILRPNYFETKKDAEEARANDKKVIAQRKEQMRKDYEELFGKSLEAADLADDSPAFYSQLSRAIAEKMPKTATPIQVLQIAKAGAKAEEIKWSGLIPWLQGKEKVSKDEVLNWLANEGAVRFTEVDSQSGIEMLESRGYTVEKGMDGEYEITDRDGEMVDFDELPDDLQALLNKTPQFKSKYSQYTLPGGTNYREVVLAMPTKRAEARQREDGKWEIVQPNGSVSPVAFVSREKAEKLIKDVDSGPRQKISEYTSSHFPDVPNYVAHMRLDERTLPDGKKTLHAAEYQSDRHQEGRKKGYMGEVDVISSIDQLTKDQAIQIIKRNEGGNDTLEGDESVEELRNTVRYYLEEEGQDETGETFRFLKNLAKTDGVADAPFRTTWPLALFKRHLRDAVQSGMDAVSWDTGETQNDRFDLSKQVEYINAEHIGEAEGVFFVDIATKGAGSRNDVINLEVENGKVRTGEFEGKLLSDVIGKDMADKILSLPQSEMKFYKGDDLKIGGSGMKGFYDQILPKEIGKYVKQWGATVEKAEIGGEKTSPEFKKWIEDLEAARAKYGMYSDEATAIATSGPKDSGFRAVKPIWRVDITEELRKAVGAGQPLFNSDLEDTLGQMGTQADRDEIRAQQEAFKEEGKVVGRPDLANPGMTEETRALFDEEDEIRKLYATRETWDQWRKAGQKLAEENEQAVVDSWLAAALQADRAADTGGLEFDAQQLNPELVVAIRIIMERRAKQAGGDPDKLAKVSILRNAYRSARANIARVMAAGVDTFKKPEERHREQLVNLITTLPEKDMRAIEERFGSGTRQQQQTKEQEIEKQTLEQIKRIEAELKKMGVTIDEILNGEVFLSISQDRIVKNITDKMDAAARLAIKLMQQGAGLDAIRRKTGLPDAKIEKIRQDFVTQFQAKLYDKVAAGMTLENMRDKMWGALENAPLQNAQITPLTKEQIQSELDRITQIGTGVSVTPLPKKSGIPTAKKVKAKIEDDEDSLEAGANRVARRWIDRLAVSQSDTLAWKQPGKDDELSKLIRAHLAKPVPNFLTKVQQYGVTAEQARVLDAEAGTERARKEMIRQWRKENPTKKKPKTLEPKKAYEVDWNRPEFSEGLESYAFTTDERTDLMKRVVELRMLTGITGTVESLTGGKRVRGDALLAEMDAILAKYKTNALEMAQGKLKAADYRFDISDRRHVAIISRTIAAINAGTMDKVQEFYYSSILSGLQTMIVNATGIINSTYQATVDRAFEGMLNAAIKSKDNASIGEYKYLMKALKPGWGRAWTNAMATWSTEIPFFEEDILNRPPDFQRLAEANNSYRPGSIAGAKGRFIRFPSRILMATDDFLNTLRASAEVGAMAFRLAKKRGLKPGTSEFQKFLQLEVNTPGSISWQMAADAALKGSFNSALPGQTAVVQQSKKKSENIVPVRTSIDFVGYGLGMVQKALTPVPLDNATKATIKTLSRMFFLPFIRVPFNIMQQGIERSINPISLIDLGVLLAANTRIKNGKFTFNADGGQARLIEYLSKQIQGTAIMYLLLAFFGEGDDDDLEKTILVTGSRPYTETKKGERELGYRMGLGPYTISIKLPGGKRLSFGYGRIEPFATMIGGSADTAKSIKLLNADKIGGGEAISRAFKGMVSQINEKTSLRGAADMLEILSGEGPIDKFAADRLASVMPNLLKQALRESDPLFREKPQDFKDMVIAAMFPSGEITGQAPKVDIYGNEQRKPGKSTISRILDPTDTTIYGASEKTDKMLYNWLRKNPNPELVAPSTTNAKTYTDPITKEQGVRMTDAQFEKFSKVSGDRIKSIVARTPFNIDNPTEQDIKRFRDIVSDSRELAKRVLTTQAAWRNLK